MTIARPRRSGSPHVGPFPSVIVPIYNVHVDLLEPCLESLRLQTLRPNEFEIVLVDDASTEAGTIRAIESFVAALPNCRLVRHTTNKGLNEARRSGRRAATGSHVLFVDGDDILTRDAVESLRMAAFQSGADIVSGGFWYWSPEAMGLLPVDILSRDFPTDYVTRLRDVMAKKFSFTMCGRLFRNEVIPDEVFDIPYHLFHEDVSTFVRIMVRAHSTHNARRPLYLYTVNPASITQHITPRHAEDLFWTFRDWLDQAEGLGLLDKLRAGIAEGVERLVVMLVGRCLSSETLDAEEKLAMLERIKDLYCSFPVGRKGKADSRIKAFMAQVRAPSRRSATSTCDGLASAFSVDQIKYWSRPNPFPTTLVPSSVATRLYGAVVLICQVDYHLRAAAVLARHLQSSGWRCVILDNSRFASGGARKLSAEDEAIFEGIERMQIRAAPYPTEWLATARLVLTFNDFNDDFRDALEYRHRFGLPSAAMAEGINDFLRVDAEPYRYLPYRRCSHVYLSGEADEPFFSDRQLALVGLPGIEALAQKTPAFPASPLAALNVNFTYGILEESRDDFLTAAVEGCKRAGVRYCITQHPADAGDLGQHPVTDKTQYELIDEASVFISRFGTGILEALASGKPAIYFNPHGEAVEKFKDPMGAFAIATSPDELAEALRVCLADIKGGVDFRERALPFLKHHASYARNETAGSRLVDAVGATVTSQADSFLRMANLFVEHARRGEHLGSEIGQDSDPDESVRASISVKTPLLGPFSREHEARLDEAAAVANLSAPTPNGRVLLDVGAHFGKCLGRFVEDGWRVIACEPDSSNREKLITRFGGRPNVVIDPSAVSDESLKSAVFFSSEESTGISALHPFRESHRESERVDVTTVEELISAHAIARIDFLKIDTEGFDLNVLKGVPWDQMMPNVIQCEFEDAKTIPLGYTYHDMVEFLVERGYTLYLSEWHPIVRYGLAHEWRQLVRYPAPLASAGAWGNILAFRNDPGSAAVTNAFETGLKVKSPPGGAENGKVTAQPTSTPRLAEEPTQPEPSTVRSDAPPARQGRAPRTLMTSGDGHDVNIVLPPDASLYDRLYVWAKTRSPIVFVVGQFAMWWVRKVRRYPWWTAAYVALLIGLVALGFVPAAQPFGAAAWIVAGFLVLSGVAVGTAGYVGFLIKRAHHESEQRYLLLRRRLKRAEEKLRPVAEHEVKLRELQAERVQILAGIMLRAAEGRLREGLAAPIEDLRSEQSALAAAIAELHAERTVLLDIVSTLRKLRPLWETSSSSLHVDKQEHGHALLVALLVQEALARPGLLTGKTLIEVGTTRERDPRQSSTEKFAIFSALMDMRFTSVDMDPANTERAGRIVRHLNPDAKIVTATGEDYLVGLTDPVDYVYLDAFDFEHSQHSPERRARYREVLGSEISNEGAWKMHLVCAAALVNILSEDGIVVIDDTWSDEGGGFDGKGKLAVPLLLSSGFTVVAQTPRAVALRRIGAVSSTPSHET